MSPSISINFDREAFDREVEDWSRLEDGGMVTEAEAAEMTKQAAMDAMKVEAKE